MTTDGGRLLLPRFARYNVYTLLRRKGSRIWLSTAALPSSERRWNMTNDSLAHAQALPIETLVVLVNLVNLSLSNDNAWHHSLQYNALAPRVPDPWTGTKQSTANPTATEASFTSLRKAYLFVTLVIMLADGMQGTHTYVILESYGFSAASICCFGFITGGITSPFTGPMVDRIGRKKATLLYCFLEVVTNSLIQDSRLVSLILNSAIGGFTLNLLAGVFESWLDTEFRRRGLDNGKFETIVRDSVIVSNMAAIFSGVLAHVLAERFGPKGPFRGAVFFTIVAAVVVALVWTENYGHGTGGDATTGVKGYFLEAFTAFQSDSRMLRVGAVQSLSSGAIQIFIFLWSPALLRFARSATTQTWGLDKSKAPEFGLIFSVFMGAGVVGGLLAPPMRRIVTAMLSVPKGDTASSMTTVDVDGKFVQVRPMAVEILAAFCYFLSAGLLLVPCVASGANRSSFSLSLLAFIFLEVVIGVFLPCEGVIRSIYFPAKARASVMSLPRFVVNVLTSVGIASTNLLSLEVVFCILAAMMAVSGAIQLSLLSSPEWSAIHRTIRGKDRAPVATLVITKDHTVP